MTQRRSSAPCLRPLRHFFLFALFAVGSLAAAARAGSVAELDHDNGLSNAPIGAPLKNFAGLKQTEETGRWLSFTRPGDHLEYLGIQINGITYNFFKDKLYSINLEVVGKRETKRMIKALEARYGIDHSFETKAYPKATATMEIREWAGAKLYCLFKSSSEFDGGVVTLLDKPTWDQLQVPRQAKEAESRSMLKGSFSNGDF